MNPNNLILIRHGASTWNLHGRYQGHSSASLSDLGKKQIQQLALAIQELRPEKIISSDLKRAIESAEIIGQILNVETFPDSRLRELDCGAWTGLTKQQISQLVPNELSQLNSGFDIARGGGESIRDLRNRIAAFLSDFFSTENYNVVAIVTHAYVIRELIKLIVTLVPSHPDDVPPLASYSTLEYLNGTWCLRNHGVVSQGKDIENIDWIPLF